MAWSYILSPAARKNLKQLSPDSQKRVLRAIGALAGSFPSGDIKKLRGSVDLWRLRVGDYRVIFRPDSKTEILSIARIGKRGDIY